MKPSCDTNLQREAAHFAALAFCDLGLDDGPLDFGRVWRLCGEHGSEPIVSPCLTRKAPGFYLDGYPFDAASVISDKITLAEACSVLVHELAHRLAYSERYEEHNARRLARLSPTEFNEAFARAVELLFVEAGGTGLRTARQLR